MQEVEEASEKTAWSRIEDRLHAALRDQPDLFFFITMIWLYLIGTVISSGSEITFWGFFWGFLLGVLSGVIAGAFWTVPLLFFGLPLSIACDRRRANCTRTDIAAALGAHPMAQSLYDLTETAFAHNAFVSNTALEALAKVLPTLDSSHYGQLPAQTIPNLCRLLDARSQAIRRLVGRERTQMELLLLDAMAHIGDARAIKSVAVLTKDDADISVLRRAEEVLAILVERDRQETEAKTLLRGSAIPPSRPNELLRAATSVASETDIKQLVRPSDSNLN